MRDLGNTVRVRTTIVAVAVVGIALVSASIALVVILADTLTQNVEELARSRAEEVAVTLTSATGQLGLTGTREDDEVVQVIDQDGAVLAWSRNVVGRPPIVTLAPGGSARAR